MIYDTQKASVLKRISAFLLDFILLAVLATGFAWAISSIVRFDAHYDELNGYYSYYYTEKYGISYDISSEEYEALTPEEKALYDAADADFASDEKAVRASVLVYSLILLITSLSLFLSYLVLEFAVPLILHNGQTVGKKVFGLGVMRVDGVRVRPILLFVRSILGKYTLETMVPLLMLIMIYFGTVGLFGIVVILGILVLQIVVFARSGTRSMLHDLLSSTVTVDLSSQMIFETADEKLAYVKRIHAETAEHAAY